MAPIDPSSLNYNKEARSERQELDANTAVIQTATGINRCNACAIRLLAGREYSQFELQQKLRAKGYDEAMVAKVLQNLQEAGLQSDERFTSCYVRFRMGRGYGPVRIQYELQNKGIAAEMIAKIIALHQEDWLEVAKKVMAKKFGASKATSSLEQAKRQKFLLYRGFDFDVIKNASKID